MNTTLPLLKRMNCLTADGAVGDAELLRRFIQLRDQSAFELLIHRHGPVIFSLCRRLLGELHEAEDAFQATFLTLAVRAHAIEKGKSLGSWLYKVAFRFCRRLRRGQRVQPLPEHDLVGRADPTDQLAARREEALVLAAEVDRLSETLRSAVILCYMQGKSSTQAARELGCAANTISIRLRRARERLKFRLSRRGVVLSTSCSAALSSGIASAALTPGMAATLAANACRLAAGTLSTAALPPAITCLMKGALVTMSFKPLKLFCLAVLTFGLVGVPLWQGFSSAQAQPPDAAYPVPILPRTANAVMARDGMAAQTRDLTLEQMMGYGSSRNQVKSAAIPEETYLPDDNLPEEAKKLIADQKAREDELYKELENRLRDQRKELHARLRKLQDSYTKMGDLDRAVALRDQVRRLDLSITQAKPDPGQLTTYRGQVGKSFVFAVVGRRGSSIWGDDGVYTDDSDIGTAAVHAGFLRPGQRGLVKVTILPGKRSYPGSTRHGVTSTPFDSFPGSYRLERADTDVRERGDQGDE